MRYFILIILFIPCLSFGQTYKVVNEKGEAIPYTTVYDFVNKDGVITNENGVFSYTSGTEVMISSVGYLQDTVLLKSCENICNIVLKQDVRQMNEVTVYSDKKKWDNKFKEGFYWHDRDLFMIKTNNPYGSTYLVKIDNQQDKPAKLLKAFYDIRTNGKTKLRVRVFSVGDDGEPAYDLLKENVIIEHFNFFTGLTINLEKYNIIMPERGVFIGLDIYKIKEDDLKFKVGLVSDRKARSYGGSTFLQHRFTLREHSVYGQPSYTVSNFRFGVQAAY